MATQDCTPVAFYAQYLSQPVIIGKFGNDPIALFTHRYEPLFLHHTSMDVDIIILGCADLADTQALLDRWHGGPAAIACNRGQEVL